VAETISLRELRNNVSDVLRRVEAGERFRVTVNRRPVAELVPLRGPRVAVPWSELQELLPEAQADRGLLDDLRDALEETTDDL